MNEIHDNVSHRTRLIRPADNPAVAQIIRQVMTEFGAVGCGFSSDDAEIDAMYEAYTVPGSAFFVIEQSDKVLGCGGMGPLAGGGPDVCELRKMYFLSGLRGSGQGTRFLKTILDAARKAGYTTCYLETMDAMAAARHLYLKHGFEPIESPLGNTGHGSCNRFMAMDL